MIVEWGSGGVGGEWEGGRNREGKRKEKEGSCGFVAPGDWLSIEPCDC